MIITVTPNPNLELTYRIERLEVGAEHRVQQVSERPGGKGLNVASVLASLGEPVTALGFLGGEVGARIERLAAQTPGIREAERHWIASDAESRRAVIVVDDEQVTVLNEPGAPAGVGAWQNLSSELATRLRPGDVVAICGSVPAGTQAGSLAHLVQIAQAVGARTVVDTSGRWLGEAARAGADLLKPNRSELAASGTTDLVGGARKLIRWGAKAVAVSSGAEGMRLFTADWPVQHWWARGPEQAGNPTGAGDAAVASWCRALASGRELGREAPALLADAVALSAAAVRAADAGSFDAAHYAPALGEIEVVEQVG